MICGKKKKLSRASGMTFIEITIVLIIIGILITIIAPGAMKWVKRTRMLKTETMLKGMGMQILLYKGDTGTYPNSLDDLVTRPSDPKIAQRWKGEYLDEKDIGDDGFGNPIEYRKLAPAAHGASGGHPYELYSWGPNGEGSPEEEWISVWNL